MQKPVSRTVRRRTSGRAGSVKGKRFVIIASRFYPAISRALIRGANAVLHGAGVPGSSIHLLWVPGAFELPVVARRVARHRPRPDAILALGALIRGDTPQYEVIAHAVAHALSQVSVKTGIPVTFGVIVAMTRAQARARAGLGPRPRHGLRRSRLRRGTPDRPAAVITNRGEEAARAALEILSLFERLK